MFWHGSNRNAFSRRRILKKLFLSLVLAGSLAMPLAGVAWADLDDYNNNPGRQQASEVGAQCDSGAGSGAFGYFGGRDNNLAGGADGYQTGLNNSAVCGNP